MDYHQPSQASKADGTKREASSSFLPREEARWLSVCSMATALYPSLFSANPMSLPQQQQPQSQQPTSQSSSTIGAATATAAAASLRRAVYVHVSDLTSAYNIDHVKLEEELARVKTEQEERKLRDEASSCDENVVGASGGTASTSPSAAALGGVPTELDTSGASQRRLQPPRAGYNLCVYVCVP